MTDERFQEYVEEFRALSRMHKVGCCHPHELLTLRHSLESSERFRVEMGSLVRSMLYREREGLTHGEMLRVVAVAWGGDDSEGTRELAAGKLGDFLREVLGRPEGEPPPIVVEVEEEEIPVETEMIAAEEATQVAGPVLMPVVVPEDPWADGSLLHRELLRFQDWRAGQAGAGDCG